ncbi:MAG: Fe-S cluster assembly protein HesB [Candidatus Promineofilum sp.]|nr:Fe-S cluster assembly protein HesB [Promineifilum sp.]
MNSTHLHLSPTPPFDFAAAAFSHGWARLAPNAWDEAARVLTRVERLDSGQVVDLRVTGADDARQPRVEIAVAHVAPLTNADQAEITRKVGHMLRVDEEFGEFYALCAARGGRWAAIGGGLGRLLRSPTVWEDVVKTIATTNTQWSGTKAMTRALCDALGEPFPGDPARRAFPTPEAVAAAPPATLAAARFGYRAPYVQELARRVVIGELELEGLTRSDLPTPELRRLLLGIKGVGPYAAATLLMLLGRYDALGYDTILRDFVSARYFAGERLPERELLAVYDDWGRWRYLAYWFEMWLADPEA